MSSRGSKSKKSKEPYNFDLKSQEREDWHEHKRMEREGDFVPTRIPPELIAKVIKHYGDYCFICGYPGKQEGGESLEIDHEWPERYGGEMDLDNLRPLCPRHHRMLGMKRTRNPFYLLSSLFSETETMPELAESDPGYSTLFLPDIQLR